MARIWYLRAQQQYVYRAGRPLGSAYSDEKSHAGEHLFFRGQRCAIWQAEIESSDYTRLSRRLELALCKDAQERST